MKIIKSCIGTKIISKWSDMACNIALDAVSTVAMEEHGRREIDIKRYAKVEKVGLSHEMLDQSLASIWRPVFIGLVGNWTCDWM